MIRGLHASQRPGQCEYSLKMGLGPTICSSIEHGW